MYRFDYLADVHAIEVTVAGFLSETEVADFFRDLAGQIRERSTDRPPSSLYNYTDIAIQSQAVVSLLQDGARQTDPNRRIAMYTEGMMGRMQAGRIASAASNFRLFDNRADAIAWLGSPPVAIAA